jgi:signal transduction histidine kinase
MSTDSHARIRPLWIFGVATALTFFSASQAFYFVTTFGDKPAPFAVLFALNLGYWYSWACLAPGILWLSRRFPLDKHSWRLSLPVHVVGVFVATTLHILMAVATRMVTYWAISESAGSWRIEAQRMFFLHFDWEMMTYWAIVGLSHALAYHREAQTRALNASQLETRLVEAQLQSLQRQLQPHFLFNTLNTIAELVHGDADIADGMITDLSELLRRTMNMAATPDVTLATELELLSLYLSLQRARFGERLRVSMAIDEDARTARVPMLLLQPIVENAVRHGLARHVNAGAIDIVARRAGSDLVVEVTDDGPGVIDEGVHEGIGLANTRARLEALYSRAAHLTLANAIGGGARVSVRLPFTVKDDTSS